jgi:hypothetical protein
MDARQIMWDADNRIEGTTMTSSKIVRRAFLVGAGIAILVLAFAIASAADPATSSGDCCDSSDSLAESAEVQYPYSSRGNPMNFQDLNSPEEDAEEGTLDQGPGQVDAEVGAGEHEVVGAQRSAAVDSTAANWVAQGIVIFLGIVVVLIAIRLIFLPSDRIPRIGSAGSGSDG